MSELYYIADRNCLNLNGIPDSAMQGNQSDNSTGTGDPAYTVSERVVLSILTTIFCLIALIGNVSVINVVWKDDIIKRHRQNFYLLSMAVADAGVVVLVVPFSLTNELLDEWPFGEFYCRVYLSVDVLLCTASIWNICVIGVDRYFSVKYPLTFRRFRSKTRVGLGITTIWIFSALVSILPFMAETIQLESSCRINNRPWYIILSSMLSFYIPSIVICPVYMKIYTIGRTIENRRKERAKFRMDACKLHSDKTGRSSQISRTEACYQENGNGVWKKEKNENNGCRDGKATASKCEKSARNGQDMKTLEEHGNYLKPPIQFSTQLKSGSNGEISCSCTEYDIDIEEGIEAIDAANHEQSSSTASSTPHCEKEGEKLQADKTSKVAAVSEGAENALLDENIPIYRLRNRSQQSSTRKLSKREKRFVFIISLVMGCFMISWTPFFTTYLVYAVCGENCCINRSLFNIFFWVGYLNSGLNPILYTIFNKDLREAFKRLYRIKN